MKLFTLIIIILSILPISSTAKERCETLDISGLKTNEDPKVLKLFDAEWMTKALVC